MNDENTKVIDEKVAEDENGKQEIILINEETIQSKIYIVRAQKVMLDFELAEIYGYTTTKFNQQVKNNIEKFDEDFMFQLTKEEFDNLISKNLTSSSKLLKKNYKFILHRLHFLCYYLVKA